MTETCSIPKSLGLVVADDVVIREQVTKSQFRDKMAIKNLKFKCHMLTHSIIGLKYLTDAYKLIIRARVRCQSHAIFKLQSNIIIEGKPRSLVTAMASLCSCTPTFFFAG